MKDSFSNKKFLHKEIQEIKSSQVLYLKMLHATFNCNILYGVSLQTQIHKKK